MTFTFDPQNRQQNRGIFLPHVQVVFKTNHYQQPLFLSHIHDQSKRDKKNSC
jgi:hypothetical protein